jgi:D-serine deaminase-like pyridoxal phosphate-dependent protein
MSSWKDKVSTPALIVYYETLIKNIKNMAKFAKENNVALRPHVKTHKCPKIGELQLNAGASGICVATVGEAEVFRQNGFEDILIANEVVEINQIKRLVELNKKSLIRVCVDSKKNIYDLNQIATKEGVKLEVLLELNVGMGRVGVNPGIPALDFANDIKEKSNLTLIGLQAFEGHLTQMTNIEHQKLQTEKCMAMVLETRDLLNDDGFDINTITVSGSATYRFSAKVEGITEIQPGTYVFSDEHLHRVNTDFDIAATVLATISNQTDKNEYTMDSGSKAFPTGDGKPIFKDYPKAKIHVVTEEHTQFKSPDRDVFEIGKKIELIPAHICPTVNLYDFLTVIKNDDTVERWDVLARGKNY